MNNEVNKQYIQRRYNRKKNACHWKLGMEQMLQYPFWFILIVPIAVLTVFIWLNMDFVYILLDVPKIILPIYTIIIKVFGVSIPILLVWGLIDVIGTLTARKDEATIQMVFMEKELRNGSPILMCKRKDKKTGVTVREWYSPIPMKLWVVRQNEIADAMSIHFVENFRYGGKSNGNRIIMHSAEGREPLTKESPVYDMDLEKDMEMMDDTDRI